MVAEVVAIDIADFDCDFDFRFIVVFGGGDEEEEVMVVVSLDGFALIDGFPFPSF